MQELRSSKASAVEASKAQHTDLQKQISKLESEVGAAKVQFSSSQSNRSPHKLDSYAACITQDCQI